MKRTFSYRRRAGRLLFVLACLLAAATGANGQTGILTRQDTLRGSISAEREWWDLTFYHLYIKVMPASRSFEGSNLIRYKVLQPGRRLQIDLQEPLSIRRVVQDGKELRFEKDGSAWFVELQKPQIAGNTEELTVFYGGKPFIATSCQGVGASSWWPCKDHMYDEPDSMRISVNVPADLKSISNGRLIAVDDPGDGTRTFHWQVRNPINSYGVSLNVADYAGWKEVYEGEKGKLDLSYYVLPENLERARKQFAQVPLMLKAFEHWFGPYPFYEDGFKVVEVPYLGMEHQSCVSYGNGYTNGYLGRDLSGTGWGLRFDFIIIHESGHEWFANNITYRDIAEMWIHEAFTSYSEALYLEYHFGKEAASAYLIGTRKTIRNQAKIMGVLGVNRRGSGDMYPKGANMLHTIRQMIDSDETWRRILRGLNKEFYHSTVTGNDIVGYINRESGKDFSLVFKQYLEDIRIPELEYIFKDNALHYRWNKVIDGFNMPVKVRLGSQEEVWLYPVANTWKKRETGHHTLTADPDFYISVKSRETQD